MTHVPASDTPPASVVSLTSLLIPAPYRGQDLEVRVSAPTAGDALPVVVFGHGFTLSSRDYQPVVDYWTTRGYAVIQPTFLDSSAIGLAPEDPRTPDIWRIRVTDMSTVVDNLDLIEAAVPGLQGRLDRTRIAAAGHSYSATTASMLLGARVRTAEGEVGESMRDPRFRTGVLYALTGDGAGLNEMAAQYFPFMRPDFTEMTAPALIVAGAADQSPLSTRGPDWFLDGFELSPGDKDLLVVSGAEHSLGGINGYHDSRTTDEDPARVALVLEAGWAHLERELRGDGAAWDAFAARMAAGGDAGGRLESK